MATALSLSQVLQRSEAQFDALAPELQRCLRWVVDHPREVGLLSMRQQAQQAGATPTSMVRLARALGFEDYSGFRRPFQDALSHATPDFGQRARELQTAGAEPAAVDRALEALQLGNVRSASLLNTVAEIDRAVDLLAGGRRIAFLGVRSCFAISYHFHYAHSLIAHNGLLVHGMGGAFPDQIDGLGAEDLLVCITQNPYGRQTIEAVQAASERGVKVLALTDSRLSPVAGYATQLLQFRADSPSYLHSMLGSLALVELLLARFTARGGQAVLDQLAGVEARLAARNAYWHPRASRKKP